MNLIGVHLTLQIGPSAPIVPPAPAGVLEALTDVEVTHSDTARSGFRLTFAIGRSGPLDFLDYELVSSPLLQLNSRVILSVRFDVLPVVIMDGLVKTRDLLPGNNPGEGTLVLSGQDVSAALEQDIKSVEHPSQDETAIASKIIASYPEYGLVPVVTPPAHIDQPLPIDRTPVQRCSDWGYLQQMASRHGYVVYVEPGPAPGVNQVCWGPGSHKDIGQRALNINLGPLTNVVNAQISHNGHAAELVEGKVKDRLTGKEVPVSATASSQPPRGLVPDTATNAGYQRKKPIVTSGLTSMQAMARAQAEVDRSSRDAVTLTGTLDSVRYNDVLRARATVEARGIGFTFDGVYDVHEVTHRIGRGRYEQDFVIGRGELGAQTLFVRSS